MRLSVGPLVWALLVLLAAGRPAAAQDMITISGTVTTRADGLSVPGARYRWSGRHRPRPPTPADGTRCRCRARWSAATGFR